MRISKVAKRVFFVFLFFILVQLFLYIFYPVNINQQIDSALRQPWFDIYANITTIRPTVSYNCALNAKARSAYIRAKSTSCKRDIINVFCKHKAGLLYPEKLSQGCPEHKASSSHGIYLGCFLDKAGSRDLTIAVKSFPHTNTPQKCIIYCASLGAPYAGLQSATECYCGSTYGQYGQVADSNIKLCYSNCPGDAASSCGGFELQEIYSTGIRSLVRNKKDGLFKMVPVQGEKGAAAEHTRVRIVFLLQFSGRAWRQVVRLFRLIYHVNHYYLIHVDIRSDYLYKQVSRLTHMYPHNVRVTSWRLATIWGGASLLDMALRAHSDLLHVHTDWRWDFVVNLSESDLPVKSHDQLVAYLTAHRDKNFLRSHNHKNIQTFIHKQGLDRLFHECDKHLWLLGDRDLPQGDLVMDGGSDWLALTRDFVKYIQDELSKSDRNSLVRGFREYFRYSLLPVESFFHTVAQNSPFCSTVANHNLHLTNWRRERGCRCQQRHVVDWCGCSPSVVTRTDWPTLKNGHRLRNVPRFFVRKFDPVVDMNVINDIESSLVGRVVNERRSSTQSYGDSYSSYWESVYESSGRWSRPQEGFMADRMLLDSEQTQLWGWLDIISKSLPTECQQMSPPTRVLGTTLLCQMSSDGVHQLCNGLLVRWSSSGNQEVSGETLFRRKKLFRVLRSSGKESVAAKRFRGLSVGRKFDVKEGLFRDYHWLSSADNPNVQVATGWLWGADVTVKLVVLDPSDTVQVVSDMKVEGVEHWNSWKLILPKPCWPGVWLVVLLDELGEPLASSELHLLPRGFVDGRLITEKTQARHVNTGMWGEYDTHLVSESVLTKLGVSSAQSERLRSEVESRTGATGARLRSHVTDLLNRRWRVRGNCVMKKKSASSRDVCSRKLDRCDYLTWSSLSPDPKSALPPVNARTGRLWT